MRVAHNREIWVLGGAGYIGSHIAQQLIDSNHPVKIFDRKPLSNNQKRFGLGEVEQITAEISSHALRGCVARSEVEECIFIHVAGPSSVSESFKKPLDYFRDHLGTTIELIKFLNWFNHQNPNIKTSIFYASSCTVYDVGEAVPFKEETRLNPTSPYAQSKKAAESVLQQYGRTAKRPVVCFRFFNAAGADPRGHLGEFHGPETHLIPLLLECAHSSDKVFNLYGDQYPTADGSCVRDFVHVIDIARAHVCGIKWLRALGTGSANKVLPRDSFQAFNLGSGVGTSVKSVIDAVATETGQSFKIQIQNNRVGDASVAVANIERARKTLGWQPRDSTLQRIIRDTLPIRNTTQ
jgi:UDP-glucose 4-epimerase